MNDMYRPPEVRVEDPVRPGVENVPLAGRMARLGAVILDGLVAGIPLIGAVVLAEFAEDGTGALLVALGAAWFVGVWIYNLYLLHKSGQSIGKKVVGVRIVRTSRERAGLGRIFALRMFVPGILSNIPILGALFGLLDALFIFGNERRCIHDYIADTVVVQAEGS